MSIDDPLGIARPSLSSAGSWYGVPFDQLPADAVAAPVGVETNQPGVLAAVEAVDRVAQPSIRIGAACTWQEIVNPATPVLLLKDGQDGDLRRSPTVQTLHKDAVDPELAKLGVEENVGLRNR